MRRVVLLTASAVLMAAAPAAGTGTKGGPSVTVDGAWARASAPGQSTGAVYATLLSQQGDTLLGVGSAAAEMSMLHQEVKHGGMASMQPLANGLTLAPRHPVTLAPGGIHIMLMGLKRPLVAGASVPITLTFAHAGSIAVSVPIEPLGATGLGAASGSAAPRRGPTP